MRRGTVTVAHPAAIPSLIRCAVLEIHTLALSPSLLTYIISLFSLLPIQLRSFIARHLTATGAALVCSHSNNSQYNGNSNGGGGTDGLRRLVALAGDRMNLRHSNGNGHGNGNGSAGLQCEVLAVYRDRAANGDSSSSNIENEVEGDAELSSNTSTIEVVRIRR